MTEPSTPSADPPAPPHARLERLVRQARWVVGLERVWPFAVLGLVAVAVFVAVSWLGLWIVVPRPVRALGVAALAAAFGTALVLGVRAAGVSRRDALARLDRDAGLPHRPISTAEDRLANGGDALTQALWSLSRKRLDTTITALRLRRPDPALSAKDPFALRAGALLALVAAAFVAGDHKEGLVAAAFDWRGAPGRAVGFRIDAWIDPPGYTRKPPVVLLAGSEPAPAADATLPVPAHAVVIVRASGEGQVDIVTSGGLKTAPPPASAAGPGPAAPGQPSAAGQASAPAPLSTRPASASAPAGATERRFTVEGSGHLTISHDGAVMRSVALTAVPDLPPTIALVGTPQPTARGSLTLAYTIGDDYGVVGADAAFGDPAMADTPVVRSLVPPPKLALNLPPTPGGLGSGQTTGDLSDHPWAGAEVTVTLSTKDEGGNVGLSPAVRMTLPARPFNHPLARALVEQRRDLVLDPDHRDGIATALQALMINPDAFGTTKAVYLGLYTAQQRLAAARTDDDLVALADYLWQMALHIEEGDKSEAARDLQAAEQALREALARNAPPDEIKRLTDALQKQMDRMLAELSRRAQSAQNQPPPDPHARAITQDQLQQMMKRMQEAAQAGNTAEAQRLLDQLQNLLDGMHTARNGASAQAQREMNRQMSELDRMTRDQQGLRDKTFRQGRSPGENGQPPGDDADQPGDPDGGQQAGPDQPKPGEGPGDLQGQQGGLRERLEALQRRMRQLGMQGEKGLDAAEQAMKDAEGALGQGPPGHRRAVDAQGRALQGLQQGANGLAQQLAQQGQAGEQQGEGEGSGDSSISRGSPGQDGDDPLGRPRDGRGSLETRGRAIDDSVAARAQRVLQELRRRLGDPSRPSEEMDYLERLLQRY